MQGYLVVKPRGRPAHGRRAPAAAVHRLGERHAFVDRRATASWSCRSACGRALLLILAFLLLVPSYLVPLYDMTMFAPQYPEGLRLHIYSYKLDGGNRGQDVKEINVLNHYIGMRDLTPTSSRSSSGCRS